MDEKLFKQRTKQLALRITQNCRSFAQEPDDGGSVD
jgi:hypothetical protein